MPPTAFQIVVFVTLGLFGFFGVVILEPEWFTGLLGQASTAHVMGHFREPQHRIHDLTFSLLLGTAAVGTLAQVRKPSQNVAAQLMALIPFIALTLIVVVTNTQVLQIPWIAVGAASLLATSLHPAGPNLFRSITISRTNRPMLLLVVIAAFPLLAFAVTNIGLERTVADDHAALGHYGFLAAFSLTVIGVGLLASLQPEGWAAPARVAGVLALLFGVISVAYLGVPSSLDLLWSVIAIGWGALFVATAERARATAAARSAGELADRGASMPVDRDPAARNVSMRAVASAIVVIVLVIVFAVLHLSGGGPGLHAPPTGRPGISIGVAA